MFSAAIRRLRGHLEPEIEVVSFAEDARREEDLVRDNRLFEILRSKRKELADESGVPPYVIFSDRTLIEMAVFFPQSSDSLLDIHGVGTVKCNKFGDLFLNIIRCYCRENQIEERPKRSRKTSRSSATKAGKPGRFRDG